VDTTTGGWSGRWEFVPIISGSWDGAPGTGASAEAATAAWLVANAPPAAE
jgi:hypothetical protein